MLFFDLFRNVAQITVDFDLLPACKRACEQAGYCFIRRWKNAYIACYARNLPPRLKSIIAASIHGAVTVGENLAKAIFLTC